MATKQNSTPRIIIGLYVGKTSLRQAVNAARRAHDKHVARLKQFGATFARAQS